jgi:hypothetical protein
MLRRNPLTVIAILAGFYAYFLTREAGRLVAGLALGLEVLPAAKHGVFLGFEVHPGVVQLTPKEIALLILSGPGMALTGGYALLALLIRWGNTIHPSLRLLLGLTCYLALVLDPIYYAVIPLFRLGGEPETLARLLSISKLLIVGIAMVILIFNTYLVQKRIVPLMK